MQTQLSETRQFKQFGVPGNLFTTIAISANGYKKLGLGQVAPADPFFNNSMISHAPNFNDPPATQIEDAYKRGDLDAVVMLADDEADFVLRNVRELLNMFGASGSWATVAAVEIGNALRNEAGEGIEHFGYVDGRSQPLYLLSDVCDEIDARTGANIDKYDPSEPLGSVLIADPLAPASANDSCGSFMVFRKLEQNVQGFRMKEQELATALGLTGDDRERAGAMAVGRFRDGTPLVLSQLDGLIPAKDNNFTHAGDPQGLKCPFQAHTRKVNPRGDTTKAGATDAEERSHRITRRAITYDDRAVAPIREPALEQLPSSGVGLLFICFQASIANQFAFMQQNWANNAGFSQPSTGVDPLIGQIPSSATVSPQNWRNLYGQAVTPPPAVVGCAAAPTGAPVTIPFDVHGFVKLLGGEFFFAPSISFLLNIAGIVANPPKPPVPPTPVPTPKPYGE